MVTAGPKHLRRLFGNCVIALAAALPLPCLAEVALSSLFSDHALLERSSHTKIWGTAAAGEPVAVHVGNVEGRAVADGHGIWSVTIDLTAIGEGPHLLRIDGPSNHLVSRDVVVGRLWLCSGQSNMELPLSRTIRADNPFVDPPDSLLRYFRVQQQATSHPATEIKGVWLLASSADVPNFSAVAYYFGKTLRRTLREPIGLLDNSWGASTIEAWISHETLSKDAYFLRKADAEIEYAKDYPGLHEKFEKELKLWEAKFDRVDRRKPGASEFSEFAGTADGWKFIKIPGSFAESGLPASGAVWLRRNFEMPPELIGENVSFALGRISDYDEAYVNGVKIGETTPADIGSSSASRSYRLPPGLLQAGEATLAVRVLSQRDEGGIDIAPEKMVLKTVNLSGNWSAKVEFALPPLSTAARAAAPTAPHAPNRLQNMPTWLFNGMLNPLLDCSIEGVLWYQGESNTGAPDEYRRLFPMMILDWREHMGRGDVPFYYCQLPNYMKKTAVPKESAWAELREAQTTALQLPATGQAVLIDVGDEGDIHPRNKAPVGDRLARIALARLYSTAIPDSGPVYKSMVREGQKIRIRFEHEDGGLVAAPIPPTYRPLSISPRRVPLLRNRPGSQLEGFAISGPDRKWVWADAEINGNEVWVWSDSVPSPTAVRYAWSDNPTCNLFNGAGLPAAPFRTDTYTH